MALQFLYDGYFAGKVGIGTASTAAILTVTGAISDDWAGRFENISTGGFGVLAKINSTSSGDYIFQARTGTTNVMTILGDGNVGIGTTSPGEKLTVHSTATAIQTLYTTNTQGGYTGYQNSTGGVKGFVGYGPTLFTGLDINNFGLRSQSGMPFATGGGNIRMYINSSGNVGIGTVSPLGRLQVNEYTVASQGNQGVHGEVSVFADDGDESLFLGLKDSAYPDRGWAFNPVAYGVNSSLQIKEHGSTAVRMTIQSGGNVGIGTTNPDSQLEVYYDSAGSTGAQIKLGSGDVGYETTITNYRRTTDSTFEIASYDDTILGYNRSTDKTWLGIGTNVGIGTTSPGYKLTVAGDAGFSDWIYASKFYPTSSTTDILMQTGAGRTITLDPTSTGKVLMPNGSVGIGTTTPNSKLTVSGPATPDLGNGENSIRIECHASSAASPDELGNGINFAQKWWSGSAGLQVTGGIYGIKNAGNGTYGGGLAFYTQPSSAVDMEQRMIIDTAGAIQFNAYDSTNNTGTPTYLLGTDASGNIVKTNTIPGSAAGPYLPLAGGTMTGTITMDSANIDIKSSLGVVGTILSSSNSLTLNARYTGDMIFQSGGAEKMRIANGGNVGIGTTSPDAKLEVAGGDVLISNGQYYTAESTSGQNFQLATITTGNVVAIGAIDYTSAGTIFAGGDNVSITTGGMAGSSRLKILNNGNVGIGTTGPNSILEVSNTTAEIIVNRQGNWASGTAGIKFATNNAATDYWTLGMQPLTNNHFYLKKNAATYLTVLDTGNVGIGTTSIGTNDKLLIKTSVDNSVAQGLVIQRSANTDEGYINYNGGGFQFRSTDGDPMVFGQVSNERVRIDPSGNVGIGTSSPFTKLHAEGVVTIKGSGSATSGSLAIQDSYGTTNHLGNIGWNRSSGGPYLAYGIKQDGSADWKSTFDNFSGMRSYMKLDNDEMQLAWAPAQQTTVDDVITGLLQRFTFQLDSGTLKLNAYDSTNQTGTPTYLLGTDASGNVVKVLGADIPGVPAGSGTLNTVAMWTPDGDTLGDSPITITGNNSTFGGGIKVNGPGSFNTIKSTNEYTLGLVDSNNVTQWWLKAYTTGDFAIHENGVGDLFNIKASGNVGIGTTSPDAKLEVAGDVLIDSGEYLSWGTVGATSIEGSTASNKLQFRTNSSDRMIINDTGVGIGTTSPSALLEIQTASTSGSQDMQIFSRGVSPNYEVLKISRSAGSTEFLANQNITLSADYDDNHTSADSNIIFKVDGDEHMRIIPGGNVGIGTSTPNTALQVNQNTTVPLLVHRPSNTSFDPHGIGFSTRNDAVNGGLGDVRSGIFSDYNGDLFLAAAQSSITTSPLSSSRLFIEGSNGNIGIGTISPAGKLHVSDTATLTAVYQKFTNGTTGHTSNDGTTLGIDSDGDFLINNNEAKEIKLYTSDVQRLTISSAGAVKFNSYNSTNNTGTPTYVLGTDASGNVVKTNTSNTPVGSNIYTMPSTTGASAWKLLGRFTANNGGQSVFIKMVTNSGYNASIDQNTEVYIRFKTSNGGSVDANGFSGDSSFYTIGAYSGYPGGNIKWVSNAAGTAATSYELYINMPQYSGNGGFYSVENTVGTWTPLNNAATDPGAASSTILLPTKQFKVGGSDLVVGAGGADSYFANSNVGIGLTNPTDKLVVAGNISIPGAHKIYNGSAADSAGLTFPSNVFRIDGFSGITFNSSTTNIGSQTERMRITNTGNVGIGTASPTSKLDITNGEGKFCVDSKTHGLTNAFTTCLTVNLNSHTGCYVTLTCFGDWGSHSAAAYRGEFFLQNGANGYNEPGIILRQDDNTSVGTDQIVCQILDPTSGANPKDFEIQIRTTATTGTTSFTGQLTYTVQGKFNSIT